MGNKSELNDIWDRAEVDWGDQYDVGDINVAKLTNGCTTATGNSNFCSTLSQVLFKGGKKRAVVIGHVEQSNPNINGVGKTTPAQQDYRHGQRRLYHNGKVLQTFTKKGRITASDINPLLKQAGV